MILDPVTITILLGWSIFAPIVALAIGWWARGLGR